MNDTPEPQILQYLNEQKSFFSTSQTKDTAFRLQQLRRLKEAIQSNQQKIEAALWKDLHKSPEETYLTEISIVTKEIDNHIRHLRKWTRPKRVPTPLHLLPSSSRIVYEPLGVALIVAPWNYPFQLLMNPLVGAISAGCCTILKPSPHTPHIARVMEDMIRETFDPRYIATVQGGKEVNQILFKQRFDVIFFTGSPALGKIVMKAAAVEWSRFNSAQGTDVSPVEQNRFHSAQGTDVSPVEQNRFHSAQGTDAAAVERSRNQAESKPSGVETKRSRNQAESKPSGVETKRSRNQAESKPSGVETKRSRNQAESKQRSRNQAECRCP